jgi:hypothetical protein
MPQTILSSLLSKASLSIVSQQTNVDIATDLKVSRVGIRLSSRVMRHMREDGTSIVDARIVQPTRVEIDVFCQSMDDLVLVNSVLLDRASVYTVKSKGLIFTSMMMEGEAIRQTPAVISASPVRITMKRLLNPSGATQQSMAQPADASLVDLGLQDISALVSGAQNIAQNVIANVETSAQDLAQQFINANGLVPL